MIYIALLLSFFANALEIPTALNGDDQTRVLEVLGLGTSTKFLSNAYPLGGYSGLEVSISVESLDTTEIAVLGNQTTTTDRVLYPTVTIGKGLYNNSDLFLHFMPANETSGIAKYGASLRWSFYEFLFLPINLSVVGHFSSANLKNKIITRNFGTDIMLGLSLNDFSFFFGTGWANSAGQFTGGTNGVTSSLQRETSKVESSHFMIGGTYSWDPVFIGFSIDRYKDEVFSFKSGFLF